MNAEPAAGPHDRTLRIGIVGAGGIVRSRHLPGLAVLDGVEVAAVCNSTYDSSRRFCEEHLPGAVPVKNWPDLVALPDLDAIWIGAQPYMHAPVSISALEAGKHLFCQARMAMDLAEAMEMRDAAAAHPELVAMLCPPPHGMKGGRTMRRLLADGVIGTPFHLRLSSLSNSFLDAAKPAHWRQRQEFSGLNALTLGIYAEVLQNWFGPIESVAAIGQVHFPIRDGYAVQIPDQLNVFCTFESGLQGSLRFGGVTPHPPSDRLDLEGSEGKLSYDFGSDRIWLESAEGDLEEVAIPVSEEQQWDVESRFIAAVRAPGSPRPEPTFERGVSYMRVVQAAADARANARTVRIGDL